MIADARGKLRVLPQGPSPFVFKESVELVASCIAEDAPALAGVVGVRRNDATIMSRAKAVPIVNRFTGRDLR